MIIRKFEKQDANETARLIRKVLTEVNSKDYPQNVIHNLSRRYSTERMIKIALKRNVYVALENGRIIGTAAIEDDYISNVFVDLDYHGKGLGSALMEKVEQIARNRGKTKVRLDACITALDFYKKRGYVKRKTILSDIYGTTFEMDKMI